MPSLILYNDLPYFFYLCKLIISYFSCTDYHIEISTTYHILKPLLILTYKTNKLI